MYQEAENLKFLEKDKFTIVTTVGQNELSLLLLINSFLTC